MVGKEVSAVVMFCAFFLVIIVKSISECFSPEFDSYSTSSICYKNPAP